MGSIFSFTTMERTWEGGVTVKITSLMWQQWAVVLGVMVGFCLFAFLTNADVLSCGRRSLRDVGSSQRIQRLIIFRTVVRV